jgi:hypothetical protein
MPKPNILPTSIRLEQPVKAAVMRYARLQGCSMSFKISQIVEAWVKEQEKKTKGEDR